MRLLQFSVLSAALVVTVSMTAQSNRAAPLDQTRTAADTPATLRLDQDKKEAVAEIDRMRVMTQQMIDQIFSFGELGYQEFESSQYLTGILEKNGFKIEPNIAGVPTAWVATWGAGRPSSLLGRTSMTFLRRLRSLAWPTTIQ